MLNGIQPNDEGLMLQAASRIAHGQVPYSDFWWFYPPGQPYLLAALWKVFGPSLLTWRLEFAAYAGVGILIACAVGRRSPLRFVGSAVGVGLVLYLPVVIAAGIGRSWDLIRKFVCAFLAPGHSEGRHALAGLARRLLAHISSGGL